MTALWGTSGQFGTGATKTPVILPLREKENRPITGLAPATPPDAGPATPNSGARFAFPAIHSKSAKPSAGTVPTAIWPPCGSKKTIRACAETAETICRRLQSNASAVLLFTSPGDGDGKTSLMISLAPELAKRAGAALAVDADFRKADLSSRLVVSAGAFPTGPEALIYPTDRLGLSVLPIASDAETTTTTSKKKRRLASAKQWGLDRELFEDLRHPKTTRQSVSKPAVKWSRELLDDLRDRWPLVLLDSPSLEHAEKEPILRYCDGAYLVVRLGHTSRRALAEAVRVIEARGGKLLGSIVVG